MNDVTKQNAVDHGEKIGAPTAGAAISYFLTPYLTAKGYIEPGEKPELDYLMVMAIVTPAILYVRKTISGALNLARRLIEQAARLK